MGLLFIQQADFFQKPYGLWLVTEAFQFLVSAGLWYQYLCDQIKLQLAGEMIRTKFRNHLSIPWSSSRIPTLLCYWRSLGSFTPWTIPLPLVYPRHLLLCIRICQKQQSDCATSLLEEGWLLEARSQASFLIGSTAELKSARPQMETFLSNTLAFGQCRFTS